MSRRGNSKPDGCLLGVVVIFGLIVFIGMTAPWIFTIIFAVAIGLLVFYIVNLILENTPVKNIDTAKIVDITQWSKEKLEPSGVSYGRGGGRAYWRVKRVPTHKEVVFDVTFTDGQVKRISTNEGSKRYESIIPYVDRPRSTPKSTTPKPSTVNETPSEASVTPIEVKKNQLTAGVYIIGKDIPSGRYDLIWVWGEGKIEKYADETTTLGASNYFQWIGNEHKYQHRQCIGVLCSDGEHLRIDGNVVVEIKRSKEIEIDL